VADVLAEGRAGRSGRRRAGVIMVVDDDRTYRQVVASLLEHAGLASVEAGSGPEALEAVAEHQVDAVIVDQSMPGMSGMDLTRRLRQMPLHLMTPILFISADDSPAVRVQALRAGATDFMVKPVEADELLARLEAQLGLADQWAERIETLRARAATVSEIASMPTVGGAVSTAREICRRISRSNGGRGVAILSWESEPVPLAATGSPVFLRDTPVFPLPNRARPAPWIHYSSGAGRDGPRPWVACAPVQVGRRPVGVLVLEGGESLQDEMLATAVDYATTAAIHLGPAMTRTQRALVRRQAVTDVLAAGAFVPVYQPVIDLRRTTVVGYEALTRLHSGQPVPDFLSEAQDVGLRIDCELAFIRSALADAGRLPAGPWLSVNLAPSLLTSRTDELASLLADVERPLVVELTENEPIEDYEVVRRALTALGGGVRLSVDDTGSGYASLRHVVDLRPHYLKLDRSWISGLESDDTRQALIAGIVGFCEHTGTELIAEGIERQFERNALENLGVVYGQGYLLGHPARPD
jgi:EAL domain-containing protein (putative c-di-GMP-specific phosphodiesterase class I)/CheY-like chemotaxis protein